MYTTLIEPAELAAHTHDPDWVVLDCRFELAKPAWGEAEYARGHGKRIWRRRFCEGA